MPRSAIRVGSRGHSPSDTLSAQSSWRPLVVAAATFQIRIEPDGKIPDIKVVRSSGNVVMGELDDGPPVAMEWLGWQRDIGGVRVYLMHFPIGARRTIRVRELAEVKGAGGEL